MHGRDVDALINRGIIELTDSDADIVCQSFIDIKGNITHKLVDSIPESIDGISIRGRFESNNSGKRRGIYYGSSVGKYLSLDIKEILDKAYQNIQRIALDWLNLICKKYGIEPQRSGNCFDTLTLALYDGTDKQISLKDHTDYGLITIGYSDEEGLELYNNGEWINVPCKVPYIHTAKWLQMSLYNRGLQPHSAIHRVKNCMKDRFFMGFFLEPAVNCILNGKSYNDFIKDAFIETYGNEHPNVNLNKI